MRLLFLLRRGALFVATATLVGCAPARVAEPFRPSESHTAYREALTQLGLEESEMGLRWITASERALSSPTAFESPAEEIVFFDPHEPAAVGYRFAVLRGRRVTILIESEHDRYFADLFVAPRREGDAPTLVASRPDGVHEIVFEPRSSEYYIVRVQPELLRGGRFRIRITETASLAFPVEGAGPEDIWSFFGDPRDGGARLHHGVDIFAPRGTPLLATGDATVVRVGQRDRGGNIVVLRDEARDLMIYYAHLEEYLVRRGARVRAGDIVGTMGNTGNAVTTPPHLHIGLYEGGWRRPIDPWNYFVDPPTTEPPTVAFAETIGLWARVDGERVLAAEVPPPSPPVIAYRNRNPLLVGAGDTFAGAEVRSEEGLPPNVAAPELTLSDEPVRIVGAAADLVRIRTLCGDEAFVDGRELTSPDSEVTAERPSVVRDPVTGDAFGELPAGTRVTVVGESPRGIVAVLASGRVALLDSVGTGTP
ncbi:MAG: M23 family metallopeptidase [Spirochaetales bacterium]|nr:M23 family metallopeptidase [Spirochaetales bacterium]